MTPRGPSTPEAKAGVAMNSLRHGLRSAAIVIPGESDEEWLAFREAVFDDYAPLGPVEEALTQRAAEALWRLRRVSRAEAQAVVDRAKARHRVIRFRQDVQAHPAVPEQHKSLFEPDAVPGYAPVPADRDLEPLIRYEAHLARQFYQADHELEARRARREGRASPLARLDVTAPEPSP